MQRLESGDLKLRVRALETERALSRVQAWQRVVSCALVASTLVNVGTVLSVSAMATGASLSFAGAGVFGLLLLSNYMKVGWGSFFCIAYYLVCWVVQCGWSVWLQACCCMLWL
jgi:hypothetical protein